MDRQPWERQRDADGNLEPALWFSRFTDYRLLGPARSILGCVNRERVTKGHDQSQYTPGSWRNASDKWRWVKRAEAWDAWQREQEEAEWTERRKRIREQDWEQGGALRLLAGRILSEGPKFLTTTRKLVKGRDGEPDREVITIALDGRLAVTAAEKGSALQRMGAEMETDRQRIVHQVEKELEGVLNILEGVLSRDDYQRVLAALAFDGAQAGSGEPAGETETGDGQAGEESA